MELKDKELVSMLKDSYPQTPQHFREVVKAAAQAGLYSKEAPERAGRVQDAGRVERAGEMYGGGANVRDRLAHGGGERARGFAKRSTPGKHTGALQRLRFAIPAAALLILGCGTAIATGKFSLDDWLSGLGANREAAELLVETEPSVDYGQDESPVIIEEYYFDGGNLVLAAKAADGSSPYYSKDHASINGIDSLVNQYENPSNPEQMIYELQPSEEIKADGGTLTLEMRFYEGDTIREASFTLENVQENTQGSREIPQQTIALPDGSVTVTGGSISPTGLKLSLHFAFEEENAEAHKETYMNCYKLTDDAGHAAANTLSTAEGLNMGMSEAAVSAGMVSWDVTFECRTLDASSEYLTVTPYIPEEDEEGKVIPDTGELLEAEAFVVSLK